jgi:hypothetical protein
MTNPIVSICIPTCKRGVILENTLKSIYNDVNIDLSLFEVVVSDNDYPFFSDENVIKLYLKFNNFKYIKCNSKGFLNTINVLKNANGDLLKLHNSQLLFNKNSLINIIDITLNAKYNFDQLFFTNGLLGINFKQFNDFDIFLRHLSYHSSWSGGFTIWKKDFDNLTVNNIIYNTLFPHFTLLSLNRNKQKFIIDDKYYFKMQFVKNKGGYNIFESFCIYYFDILNDLLSKNNITLLTYNKIKYDLLNNFFYKVFFKNIYTKIEKFETKNYNEYLNIHYTKKEIFKMRIKSIFYPILKIKNNFANVFN